MFHTLVEVMSSERVRLYQWENLEHYKWIQEKYDNRPRLHFHLFQNIFVARNIIFRNSILMYESRSFALRVKQFIYIQIIITCQTLYLSCICIFVSFIFAKKSKCCERLQDAFQLSKLSSFLPPPTFNFFCFVPIRFVHSIIKLNNFAILTIK